MGFDMNTMLITGLGLAPLAVAFWQMRRRGAGASAQISPEWIASIGRIANAQALGHHREVRRGVLQAMLGLEQQAGASRMAQHVRVRLAALLAKDPVYPEVLRAIRAACAAEPAITELALCVRLRQFLVEDIRQCEELAEHLGQIRRRNTDGDALLIARFSAAA